MVKVYWKAILWNICVIVLSLMPSDGINELNLAFFPHQDKVIHFIMYAVLTFLILQKNHLFEGKMRKKILLTISVLYAFFMGFFLEILQNSFLIGRNFDIFDVLANTTGIIIAVVFYRMFHH